MGTLWGSTLIEPAGPRKEEPWLNAQVSLVRLMSLSGVLECVLAMIGVAGCCSAATADAFSRSLCFPSIPCFLLSLLLSTPLLSCSCSYAFSQQKRMFLVQFLAGASLFVAEWLLFWGAAARRVHVLAAVGWAHRTVCSLSCPLVSRSRQIIKNLTELMSYWTLWIFSVQIQW